MAYNSAYTGSQVDAAVGAVREKESTWDGKQDKLNGTEDQIVGFNSDGEAVAVAKPDPLPAGGETGQVLTKTAEGTAWDDIPSDLPAGGTDGQILTKTAEGVAWEDAPEGGVTSFKGRTGTVTPQSGDYTAEMVGARPSTWTPSAADVGARPDTWMPSAEDVGALTQDQADERYLQMQGTTTVASSIGAAPYTIEFTEETDEVPILTFGAQSVATSAWATDTTYEGWGFRAAVALSGVTADYVPSVTFGIVDATSGNLAPVADTYAGGVYIYAKEQPTAAVSIASVVCCKGV